VAICLVIIRYSLLTINNSQEKLKKELLMKCLINVVEFKNKSLGLALFWRGIEGKVTIKHA